MKRPDERVPDDEFAAHVARILGQLPRVEAVMLGGSRAYGAHEPEADWDFAIYYRDHFDVEHLRALGWPGTVDPLGGWGGGVFNGGAHQRIAGRRVDIHYRDLTDVERRIAEAEHFRKREARARAHLLGSSVGPGAAGRAGSVGPSGRRRGDRTQGARPPTAVETA